jgi:2-polyprenyl-3-methyl-5-hydroxy-6-metoxy-1,4-benzoquinol methylase
MARGTSKVRSVAETRRLTRNGALDTAPPMASERETRSLYYDRMVADADWDERTNRYETARRLHLIFDRLLGAADLAGAHLLDAGSGGGHFSEAAVARGARVTSLDVGEHLLAQVAKRCESIRVLGSILALPFDDGAFNVVLSTEVLEHTPEPRAGLRELCRVVKPSGLLVVTTPNRLWQPVVRGATRLGLRHYAGYENFIWPREARRIVRESGLSIERFIGFNLLPLFNRRFEPLLAAGDRFGAVAPSAYVNFALVARRGPAR